MKREFRAVNDGLVKTADRSRAEELFNRLTAAYPAARCGLGYAEPHELLVATILSAQCTDQQVNAVTPGLFRRYPTVRAFAEADPAELTEAIRPTGFYRHKARAIQQSMRMILERFGGRVPDRLEDLVSLTGVGRKTANVVLGDAFGKPGVVVDTHVRRLAQRLGLTNHRDPVKIEFDLRALFQPTHWTLLGHLLIAHGRAICRAQRPRCRQCPLRELCPAASPHIEEE